MTTARVGEIDIEYDTYGDPGAKPLLLVMGLGAQMTMWDEAFCSGLAELGHFVIRYDARDTGLSTKFEEAGIPNLIEIVTAVSKGETADVPYLLSDMADDAAAC